LKKLSLLGLVSLWLLCSSLTAQSQGLDFYLYSSDQVRSLENNLEYYFHPFANSSFKLSGQSNLENRLNFNQESKNAILNLGLSIEANKLLHRFSSDYSTLFDQSDLEPSPYINKTATLGYELSYNPLDSLSLDFFSEGIFRREQDRYVSNKHLSSRGYTLGSKTRMGLVWQGTSLGLYGQAKRNKMAWQAFDDALCSLNLNHLSENFNLDSQSSLSYRDEDIYVLQAPAVQNEQSYYRLSDTQQRTGFNWSTHLNANPRSDLKLMLSDDYALDHTSYIQSPERGSEDYQNIAQLNIKWEIHPRLSIDIIGGHQYAIKVYDAIRNGRRTEFRQIGSRFAWEYADYDSLIALTNLDLQIVTFPYDNNKWDNDLLTRSYKLGWKHYYKERIKLGNWLGYGQREDVYIDSLLSANNKMITSYTLAPECQILLGDRLMFSQVYQLRSEYSDFIFDTGKQNSFFRQLSYKFNLIFDTFPLIARFQDPIWLSLPYRNSPNNAVSLDLGFAYEENQYANERTGFYELYTKNKRWTSSLSLRQDIGSFYWSLTPKFSWGTWTEYNAELALAWEFNNQSQVYFSLSPYAEDLADINWRSSTNLSLRF
jgi:hypothetical protein